MCTSIFCDARFRCRDVLPDYGVHCDDIPAYRYCSFHYADGFHHSLHCADAFHRNSHDMDKGLWQYLYFAVQLLPVVQNLAAEHLPYTLCFLLFLFLQLLVLLNWRLVLPPHSASVWPVPAFVQPLPVA